MQTLWQDLRHAARVLRKKPGFTFVATDPSTFTAIPERPEALALPASFVPARRTARVDPVVALRYE